MTIPSFLLGGLLLEPLIDNRGVCRQRKAIQVDDIPVNT